MFGLLFILLFAALLLILFRKKEYGSYLTIASLLYGALLLFLHMTDTLQASL